MLGMLKWPLFLLLLSTSSAYASAPSCLSIFAHFTQLEPLLVQMAAYETKLTEALASPQHIQAHGVLSLRLVELQQLINEALSIAPMDKARVLDLSVRFEEVTRGVDRHLIRLEIVSAPSVSQTVKTRVDISKHAEKDLSHLQHYLQSKYQEFVRDVQALEDIHRLPPHWKFEKLNVVGGFGTNVYSVRLNVDYRVVFSIEQGRTITVHRISQTLTHHGH